MEGKNPGKRKSGARRISAPFIAEVSDRLRDGLKVRRKLPDGGRLHIDRQLPFLVVYRRPAGRRDGDTGRLVMGEASYMMAPGARKHHQGLSSLIEAIARAQSHRFGAFLLMEIWARKPYSDPDDHSEIKAQKEFGLIAPGDGEMNRVVEALQWGLTRMKVDGLRFTVKPVHNRYPCPPGKGPLLTRETCLKLNAHQIGLELPGFYYDPDTGEPYPILLRKFHRRLARVFKMGVYEFTRFMTTHEPSSYHALGRRTMVKAVWEVDRQLSEIDSTFDFLLMASPTNPEQSWARFKRNRYERTPEFLYRPVPVDPTRLKRALYRIPLEKVEDPTIAYVFREKQEELDRLISMLSDRGSKRFLYGSLHVFGGVEEKLKETAIQLLEKVPSKGGNEKGRDSVNASQFASLARQEVDHYRASFPGFAAKVEVRDDILGLVVSRDSLLIGRSFSASRKRADALLQHEIGTHLLTYVNAAAQPFKLLRHGLAGYSDLQEGLAVLAEYLSGGLTPSRVRLMAARVVAISHMTDGATFIECFRELVHNFAFTRNLAYRIALKTYRGGGLTKDAVYLRGLMSLLRYLEKGGDIDILFLGKVNKPHLPIIRELLARKVLTEPILRPRFMGYPETLNRLDLLKSGLTVRELLK